MMRDALVYLAAAVSVVPLARRLGLGSVLGYLIAGVAIGPWGLGFVRDVESMLHFSEFGVVLMLFVIGLELDPEAAVGDAPRGLRRRRAAARGLRRGARRRRAWPWAARWKAALVAGLALALSSTAIAMQTMEERNLLADAHRAQRLRRPAVPGHRGDPAARARCRCSLRRAPPRTPRTDWTRFAVAIARASPASIVIGRYLTRPVLRIIAADRTARSVHRVRAAAGASASRS